MANTSEPLLDFGHLRSGQVYRVRRAFAGAQGQQYRIGQQCTYLTHVFSEQGDLVTLVARDTAGMRFTIPMRTNRNRAVDLIYELRGYLARVPEVAPDFWPVCACDPGGAAWGEVYHSLHERVRLCLNCGVVLVMQPVVNGVRMIPLDDEARAAVARVAELPANPPFVQLLHAALNNRSYPANVMAGSLLARHSGTKDALVEALQSDSHSMRQVALEFVAQLEHVNESLEPWILQLVRSRLEASPPEQEHRWALEALLAVVDRAAALTTETDELRGALRAFEPPDPEWLRYSALDLLTRSEELARRTSEERDAAVAVLRRLVKVKDYDQADQWLGNWGRDYTPHHQVSSRALLAEEAGDGMTAKSKRAARWLYERSVRLFEEQASWHFTNEGLARGWHAVRLAHKLADMDRHLQMAAQEHEADVSIFRQLVIDGRHEEAVEWVDEWAQRRPEGNELLARAHLYEEAGDGLAKTEKSAAQWMYERANGYFEQYLASLTERKGASEGRHVRRLRRKLAHLVVLWSED